MMLYEHRDDQTVRYEVAENSDGSLTVSAPDTGMFVAVIDAGDFYQHHRRVSNEEGIENG